MSSKRSSTVSVVSSNSSSLTPEERHQIIVEYLERINKPTKVFHLRWKPGELLTGEVLESTPMFWYMKYQWSRQEIEEMFYAARCVIGPVFGQSLQQTYGGTAGPRWRGDPNDKGIYQMEHSLIYLALSIPESVRVHTVLITINP